MSAAEERIKRDLEVSVRALEQEYLTLNKSVVELISRIATVKKQLVCKHEFRTPENVGFHIEITCKNCGYTDIV